MARFSFGRNSLLLLPAFLSVALCSTCTSQDFTVQYNGSGAFFSVGTNGTCTCANDGFAGSGRLLTNLDQNPTISSLSGRVSALQTTIAAQQASIAALMQAVSTSSVGAVPASTLVHPIDSCRTLKETTPNATTSGRYDILDYSGNFLEWYCDMTTDGGGWTMVWKAPQPELNSLSLSYFNGAEAIIYTSTEMMFAFASENNSLTQAWKFAVPPAFIRQSPMQIGYCNYNLVNATRLSDGLRATKVLRAGYSDFAAHCDDGCFAPGMQEGPYVNGSIFGQICLKDDPTIPSPRGAGRQGFLDFPHFSGFASDRYQVDKCSNSDTTFDAANCTASRLFSIFVR